MCKKCFDEYAAVPETLKQEIENIIEYASNSPEGVYTHDDSGDTIKFAATIRACIIGIFRSCNNFTDSPHDIACAFINEALQQALTLQIMEEGAKRYMENNPVNLEHTTH